MLLPYSLPRLNGGSANTVSITFSAISGKTAMQSAAKSAPWGVVKTGATPLFDWLDTASRRN